MRKLISTTWTRLTNYWSLAPILYFVSQILCILRYLSKFDSLYISIMTYFYSRISYWLTCMVSPRYVFSYVLLRYLIEKTFYYKCRNEMAFPQSVFYNVPLNLLLEKMTCYNQSIDMVFRLNEYACAFLRYLDAHTWNY